MIQYKTNVLWDKTLCALEFVEDDAITREAGIAGLCQFAIKITTGAPTATVGKFIRGAQIQNAVDGTWYEMTGTTASPAWSLVPSTGSGITTLTGDVTAGPGTGSQAATIAANAVTTAKILNANVTLAKLSAGITPSHVVKFAGTASGGTTATRAYTVTGALATDVATAVIRASTNAVTIQKATLTSDTLTVLFSADPGTGTTVDYSILRAAV